MKCEPGHLQEISSFVRAPVTKYVRWATESTVSDQSLLSTKAGEHRACSISVKLRKYSRADRQAGKRDEMTKHMRASGVLLTAELQVAAELTAELTSGS